MCEKIKHVSLFSPATVQAAVGDCLLGLWWCLVEEEKVVRRKSSFTVLFFVFSLFFVFVLVKRAFSMRDRMWEWG